MFGKEQSQESGDNSINAQAGRDLVVSVTGLSYGDARQLFLDLFEQNFYKLADVARQTASERAHELFQDFIGELERKNPDLLGSAIDPGMQYMILTAQRDYARTGDRAQADILVQLLVDRASTQQRDLLQIVLDESIETASKLAPYQYDVLSLVFFLRVVSCSGDSLTDLREYLDWVLTVAKTGMDTNEAGFRHLAYSGCASIEMGEVSIERLFLIKHADLTNVLLSSFDGKDSVENQKAIFKALIDFEPAMEPVIDTWNSSTLKHVELTSVGIAIGASNLTRMIGKEVSLETWIC